MWGIGLEKTPEHHRVGLTNSKCSLLIKGLCPWGSLVSQPDIVLCWKCFLIYYGCQAIVCKEYRRKSQPVASWSSLTCLLLGEGSWGSPVPLLLCSPEVAGSDPHRTHSREKGTHKLPYLILWPASDCPGPSLGADTRSPLSAPSSISHSFTAGLPIDVLSPTSEVSRLDRGEPTARDTTWLVTRSHVCVHLRWVLWHYCEIGKKAQSDLNVQLQGGSLIS